MVMVNNYRSDVSPVSNSDSDSRPKDNSPHEKLNLRQLAPDSEDNSPHFVSLNSTLNAQLNDLKQTNKQTKTTTTTTKKKQQTNKQIKTRIYAYDNSNVEFYAETSWLDSLYTGGR